MGKRKEQIGSYQDITGCRHYVSGLQMLCFKRNKTFFFQNVIFNRKNAFSSKTNGVDEFTYDNYEEFVSSYKNNISSDTIFLLFFRFTSTRSLKKGEDFKDIKIKELNGYFDADDRILRGFYKRVFSVETKGSKHKFFYKEIPFDSKGTIEVIISNYQSDGFKLVLMTRNKNNRLVPYRQQDG